MHALSLCFLARVRRVHSGSACHGVAHLVKCLAYKVPLQLFVLRVLVICVASACKCLRLFVLPCNWYDSPLTQPGSRAVCPGSQSSRVDAACVLPYDR